MNKKTLTGIIVVVVVLIGVGAWFTTKTTQKYTGPVEELSIAVSAEPFSTLLWVADAQGYFADYGLDVTFQEFESGPGAAIAFLNGEFDLSATIEFLLAAQLLERDDLRVISSIGTADVLKIISRRDRAVRLSDLRGKKIGLIEQSIAPFLFARTLIQERVPYDAVTIVDMFPPQMEGALSRGEVDAVVIWSPTSLEIIDALGDEVMSWPSQAGQEMHWLLFGFSEWVAEHPEALKRLLGALVEAESFVMTNEEATKNILAASLGRDRAYVDHFAWPGYTFGVSLSQSLIIALEDEGQWHIQNNPELKGVAIPNYLDFIYFDALDAVNPEAVTIIQ